MVVKKGYFGEDGEVIDVRTSEKILVLKYVNIWLIGYARLKTQTKELKTEHRVLGGGGQGV